MIVAKNAFTEHTHSAAKSFFLNGAPLAPPAHGGCHCGAVLPRILTGSVWTGTLTGTGTGTGTPAAAHP